MRNNLVELRFPKINVESMQVIGVSDASFATNRDATSHIGYILFIADAERNVIPILFKSYKARRVTRSVIVAELVAFSDMFDAA